jgi:hypothetical protein
MYGNAAYMLEHIIALFVHSPLQNVVPQKLHVEDLVQLRS